MCPPGYLGKPPPRYLIRINRQLLCSVASSCRSDGIRRHQAGFDCCKDTLAAVCIRQTRGVSNQKKTVTCDWTPGRPLQKVRVPMQRREFPINSGAVADEGEEPV